MVFPHKMGPPFKRALKFLAADHLKRIIQNDGEIRRGAGTFGSYFVIYGANSGTGQEKMLETKKLQKEADFTLIIFVNKIYFN